MLILLLTLFGCELIKFNDSPIKPKSHNINYAQYYLSLTKLSDEEIAEKIHKHKLISQEKNEANRQHKINNALDTEQQFKSVLLFALPDTSNHNPFTAKSKLNQLSLENLKDVHLTYADFAFFNMLKTQLNQQILLLNKLSAEKKALYLIKENYHHQQDKFEALQQQIIQLKKIESNINEHGQ
jgi:hypothetical protein